MNKEKIIRFLPRLSKILAIVATFSLYMFLFDDFFNVYNDAEWYAICATYLTIYLYAKSK